MMVEDADETEMQPFRTTAQSTATMTSSIAATAASESVDSSGKGKSRITASMNKLPLDFWREKLKVFLRRLSFWINALSLFLQKSSKSLLAEAERIGIFKRVKNRASDGDSNNSATIPMGSWRDGFWDLCRHGVVHPTVWCSLLCVPIAVGQVISRLHLTIMAKKSGETNINNNNKQASAVASRVFSKLLLLVISYWIVRVMLLLIIAYLDPNVDSTEWMDPPSQYYVFCALDDLLAYLYWGITVIQLWNLRKTVREQYDIPESGRLPAGWEDGCASLFCPCFTVAQIMRHTANYDTQPARCCTKTGLPLSSSQSPLSTSLPV